MQNDENLLLITGAGASSHFGYPTGGELIELISLICDRLIKQDFPELKHFKERINQYNPINIDYFLNQHREQYAPPGKRLIETAINCCENRGIFGNIQKFGRWWKGNSQEYDFPNGNWVKFLHHSLVANCTSVEEIRAKLNRISILTFNYDISFEQSLWKYFEDTDFDQNNFPPLKAILQDFFENQVYHIYGKVKNTHNGGDYFNPKILQSIHNIDHIFSTSKGDSIQVIGVEKSSKREQKIDEMLSKATQIFFLGYGFDEFNNRLLGLDKLLENNKHLRKICYTNYSDSLVVDMAIREIYREREDNFINALGGKLGILELEERRKVYILKSTKNVYDALASDFQIPIL